MKTRTYYVYILTNKNHSVLYVGVTNDIVRRVFEHKVKRNKGFTYRYNVSKLVYYEEFGWIEDAIHREKRIKKYQRQWKIDMINHMNPDWNDLSADWYPPKL